MRTDELIDRLAENIVPVSAVHVGRVLAIGLGAGAVLSAGLMTATIGIRSDLMDAMGGSVFWLKFVYTFVTAAIGLFIVNRLSRPDPKVGRLPLFLAVPFVIIAVLALVQILPANQAAQHALIMGHSARVCSLFIAALALPLFAGLFWALRQLAPTRLTAAGGAAGLLAGSAAASIYAFHCTESTPTFIAIWYSAGILVTALLGAVMGRWLLRW